MKIAGCVEYDGSKFCGWQIQHGQPSVQSAVEQAFSNIANHKVSVHCAGRTDTGVHACGQIFHFETENQRTEYSWVMGANSKLPEGVTVIWTKEMDQSFHARFSAISRTYRYIILNRRMRPSYLAKKVSWYIRDLDVQRMNSAAQSLIGTHDFSAFRSSHCRSKVAQRSILVLEVNRKNDWVWIDIEANGFLHHMVRNIAGVLLAIGSGACELDWIIEVLNSKNRTKAGVTAPADGLYFVSASYPQHYELPRPRHACRFW